MSRFNQSQKTNSDALDILSLLANPDGLKEDLEQYQQLLANKELLALAVNQLKEERVILQQQVDEQTRFIHTRTAQLEVQTAKIEKERKALDDDKLDHQQYVKQLKAQMEFHRQAMDTFGKKVGSLVNG